MWAEAPTELVSSDVPHGLAGSLSFVTCPCITVNNNQSCIRMHGTWTYKEISCSDVCVATHRKYYKAQGVTVAPSPLLTMEEITTSFYILGEYPLALVCSYLVVRTWHEWNFQKNPQVIFYCMTGRVIPLHGTSLRSCRRHFWLNRDRG